VSGASVTYDGDGIGTSGTASPNKSRDDCKPAAALTILVEVVSGSILEGGAMVGAIGGT